MIKPLSFAPGVRERLNGYHFDREMQDNLATQMPFHLEEFRSGRPFSYQHCGIIFRIESNQVKDFRLVNPYEFDVEGCEDRGCSVRMR